jgi:hypothetical protein
MTLETRLEPEGARSGATRITQAADTLHSRWGTIRGQIEALHGQHPWGNDEAGNAFNEKYSQGGQGSPAGKTIEGSNALIDAMKRVGPAVTQAVNTTVATDNDNAGRVNQAY